MTPHPSLRTIVSYVVYPLLLFLGITFYLTLQANGLQLQISNYLTVVMGALLITLLEKYFPHLSEWQGTREDVQVDLVYMLTIQVALPPLLGISLALGIQTHVKNWGIQVTSLWPHDWPLGLQVVLMLLVADFFRYWFHKASHTYAPLWRLHAVHHSPPKLYWLNVGRFHPIEKTLQYLLDALPFILAGISEQVLALYFVFYAINGFFQHSNVELRYGPLNYIISSAELHRWHHSSLSQESNSNYGNNLIIWDLLFGTRFLPKDKEVASLGLPNRTYPATFLAQLKTPFLKNIERQDAPQLSWYDLGLNVLIRIRMLRLRWTDWQTLEQATLEPEQVQQDVLTQIMKNNQHTQFGREHQFHQITTLQQYTQLVPIQTFESLWPYIEKQDMTHSQQLTKEHPILYAQTSGTTGAPKYIPLLPSSFALHKKNQNLVSYIQYRDVPQAYAGKFLVIVSPAIEGYRSSGIPFGSISGSLYKNLPIYLKAKYVIPAEVFDISDYETKYFLILRIAILQKNITSMASANPSTFLKLLDTLHQHREQLLSDLQNDRTSYLDTLPTSIRDAIHPHLICSKERKSELEGILSQPHSTFRQIWPFLQIVTTWTGGSCGIALEKVRPALPASTKIMELGYLASEFRGSLPISVQSNQCIPTLTDNVFEFVTKERWEQHSPEFLGLHQIQEGQDYYVFVTTPSGLYRYTMNDIIRVTGHFHNTPSIQFLQKGKGVTNITGEKLYESQVLHAMQLMEQELSISASFFLMLADPEGSCYHLLVELDTSQATKDSFLSETLEKHLMMLNIEYHQKRSSGRLGRLRILLLRQGTGEAYKMFCLKQGQREGQFKTLMLQYLQDLQFPYQEYLLNPEQPSL